MAIFGDRIEGILILNIILSNTVYYNFLNLISFIRSDCIGFLSPWSTELFPSSALIFPPFPDTE